MSTHQPALVEPSPKAAPREPRLDLLKAIAISFVVLWHLHPVYVEHAPLVERLVRFFELEVSLTAVPIFLIVSLRLLQPGTLQPPRLARRLARLAGIFLFWTAVQFAIAALVSGWPRLSLEVLRLGGPPLPIIGASVFYYLFDLIALTLLAFLHARIPEPARTAVSVSLVVGSLAYFEWAMLVHHKLEYYELANFVVYVPIALHLPRLLRHWRWFLAAWVVLAVRDVHLDHQMDCAYGRGAILCGALALVGACFSRPVGDGRLTRGLAGYSLGVYALHKYCLYLVMTWKDGHSLNVPVGRATVHLAAPLVFIATGLLTAASVSVLARTPLKRFVA